MEPSTCSFDPTALSGELRVSAAPGDKDGWHGPDLRISPRPRVAAGRTKLHLPPKCAFLKRLLQSPFGLYLRAMRLTANGRQVRVRQRRQILPANRDNPNANCGPIY